jgi:hypothetical protein
MAAHAALFASEAGPQIKRKTMRIGDYRVMIVDF